MLPKSCQHIDMNTFISEIVQAVQTIVAPLPEPEPVLVSCMPCMSCMPRAYSVFFYACAFCAVVMIVYLCMRFMHFMELEALDALDALEAATNRDQLLDVIEAIIETSHEIIVGIIDQNRDLENRLAHSSNSSTLSYCTYNSDESNQSNHLEDTVLGVQTEIMEARKCLYG